MRRVECGKWFWVLSWFFVAFLLVSQPATSQSFPESEKQPTPPSLAPNPSPPSATLSWDDLESLSQELSTSAEELATQAESLSSRVDELQYSLVQSQMALQKSIELGKQKEAADQAIIQSLRREADVWKAGAVAAAVLAVLSAVAAIIH